MMIPLSAALPALPLELLSLYYTQDLLLEGLPVLVFCGPSTTANSTLNSSRIQAHIYSLAGFHSIPRLTVAPTSPLYAAVNHLPADLQGDEVYRGLAVSLLSYFAELPQATKAALRDLAGARRPDRMAPMMFDEMHAGDLAAKMARVEAGEETVRYLNSAIAARSLSYVDMDVVLPPGTIQRAMTTEGNDQIAVFDDGGLPLFHYGQYTPIIESLGSPAFLPTSKIQRAPSRPIVRSKSKVLVKDQKISLRREMCELVDTESNYLDKVRNLVDVVTVGFCRTSNPAIIHALFPESLKEILELNEAFYHEVLSNLDATENDAIKDIEGDQTSSTDIAETITQSRRRDPTGASSLGKLLVKWFPRFMTPYQAYLRASIDFPHIIAETLLDDSSTTSAHLRDFGEQRLRSALIEPVQRLPRYSLFIDNMVNLLPASHPALASLLKAKDLITDICALDNASFGNITRTTKILRNMVSDWPESFLPCGRLITAVDVAILEPPYSNMSDGAAGMLLLFSDALVLLRKVGDASLSARGLLAETDRPSIIFGTAFSSALDSQKVLRLSRKFDLPSLGLTESIDGRLIYVNELDSDFQAPEQLVESPTWVFSLLSPYDGKSARFCEEFAKARIEGRYSEEVRESNKWALRSITGLEGQLHLLVALSEGFVTSHNIGEGISKIYVSFDKSVEARPILTKKLTVDVAISIAISESAEVKVEAVGRNTCSFTDSCTTETLVPILIERIKCLLLLQHQRSNPAYTASQVSFDRDVLDSLPLRQEQAEKKHRTFRPMSPVKLISNMLGNSVNLPKTPSKSRGLLSSMKPITPFQAPNDANIEGRTDSVVDDRLLVSKVIMVDINNETLRSPLELLEDTFAAYIISLHSRSGNVVGRVLQGRAAADELAVNELYNTLLENPGRIEAAALVPVDVLFAAFENFLRRAWRERMGPLLPPSVLQNMQTSFDSGKPTVFTEQVKSALEDMSPQNRRALAATVKLLADLLEASGNDGDRGILIASFAEALVLAGNPHDYFTLLDRLVDDYDNLFEDASANATGERSATGSLNRTRSFNAGSLSSNASSLKRKLGLGGGLTRENSKSESESKIASIWRTLSKNGKSQDEGTSQVSSLSKGSLIRSRSTDTDTRMLPPSRPLSRDRPTTSSSTPSENPQSRPGSAHIITSALNSIGEETASRPTNRLKKKRRSSLSDLKSLEDSSTLKSWSPLQVRTPNIAHGYQGRPKPASGTPSPAGKPIHNQRLDGQSTQRSGIPQRLGSPRLKENSPSRDNPPSKENSPLNRSVTKRTTQRSNEVTITGYSPQKGTVSRSNIPARKGSLSQHNRLPHMSSTVLKKANQTPQKLRMHSPQKLRERLNQEQKSQSDMQGSLQEEIDKISNEMSAFQPGPSSQVSPLKKTSQADLRSLTTTLASIEDRLHAFIGEHTERSQALRSDVETSLLVSEKKVRKLDDLYKEANAENEALYERFNDELRKVLGRIRKGEGVDEMRKQLDEAQGEAGRLKAENARLKGEIVGLRSMVRED